MRNTYVCEPIIAYAIFLNKMATLSRCFDCEVTFGKYSSKLSEIFWEVIELINLKCGSLLDVNVNVLQQREFTYANSI